MAKFVTLSMILDTRLEPNMDEHTGAGETLPFLSWTIGHKVVSNGGDDHVWKIVKMLDANGNDVATMTYFLSVVLENERGETKTIRGATLQTGYSITGLGEDDGVGDPAPTPPPVPTKPVTFAVDQIRNFYPRKGDKPGTRVILKSGTAYVVSESHGEVLAKVEA